MVQINSAICWWVVALLLIIFSFGIINIVYFVLYIACFIVGAVAILHEYCQKEVLRQKNYFSSPFFKQAALLKPGIECVCNFVQEKIDPDSDSSLTGSADVDAQINTCLDYLLRDYVKYWYNDLSDDDQFLGYFRLLLQHCIRDISGRCQSKDWQPYLSTVLVDQFASHLKSFRKAKQELNIPSSSFELSDYSPGAGSDSQPNGNTCHDNDDEQKKTLLLYFEKEIESENLCRDLIACDSKKRIAYFQDICEILLYIVLPEKEFQCKPFMYILRETMVQGIFFPMFKLYSSSDYLNQYICWLISDNCITSEWFLAVLRHTHTMAELSAVRDKAEEEIEKLTSKDRVGDDPIVKQQLGSMRYVKDICQRMIYRHQEQGTIGYSEYDSDGTVLSKGKLYNFPLSLVLRNNIALQIFIEYMQSVGGQAYLFFWLTVDGYRASAEQQLSELKVQQLRGNLSGIPDMEMLRTIGHNIYEQYLSKNANPRVPLDPNIDKLLKKKLYSAEPSPFVFDDIQLKVFNIMQKEERFFPEFKTSPYYIKMLAELDLLNDPSLTSADTNESMLSGSSLDEPDVDGEEDSSRLTAMITQTGVCTEHGKTYALYAITVTRVWLNHKEESWGTFRRYREFYDLHCSLKENGSLLGNLRLPGKTFFKDLKEEFLEKRRGELNEYLSTVLNISHPPKAMECLHTFLDAKAYQRNSRSFTRKVDTMVRSSVRNVTNFVSQAPDSFIDGIQKASDKVSDGFHKITDILPSSIEKRDPLEKLQEQIDYNVNNNLPIGILLLLLDEVFDLKRKNQWLRRQLVAALQQVLRTLFGDRMNKKIIDYVHNAMSAEQIAQYIKQFRDNFWPNGILADDIPAREESVVMRTRVLAKTKMHGVIPDELRPIVGNETCRRGIHSLFELMQYEELNLRFCCVLLEGIIKKIFPGNKFEDIFEKFHSLSPKRAHKRKMMSKHSKSVSTKTMQKKL